MDGMDDLVQSILQHGLIEPIVVRPQPDGRYKIIAGHRRWIACKRAGLTEIAAVVRDVPDDKAAGVLIAENLYRRDLKPLEEARFYRHLCDGCGYTVAQIAELIGRSETYVRQRLSALDWPQVLIDAVDSEAITWSGALELMRITDETARDYYITAAISGGASLPVIREWVRQANAPTPPPAQPAGGGSVDFTPPPGKYLPSCWFCGGFFEPSEITYLRACKGCVELLLKSSRSGSDSNF